MVTNAVSPPPTQGHVIHWARWYDTMTGLLPFLRGVREKLLELAAPARGEDILDAGCGTGTLAIALKARLGAGRSSGIDASPEMIAVAKDKAARTGADVDFRIAAVEALPYPDASFDLVTSSLMLHHLPVDAKRNGLREIRRVLKPGGRFVALDFAARSHGPLSHLLAVLGHAHGATTLDELQPLLAEAGFGEVEALPTRHRRFVFVRAR
jgi:ubiquinone/menaquinone biosynthesis C-methylase UbiE